jgi:hypothetical protein
MTTAVEYRQYAQECIQSARDATNDTVRKQFLDLAKLWMTAADRLDARGLPLQPDKLDGQKPPRSAGSE